MGREFTPLAMQTASKSTSEAQLSNTDPLWTVDEVAVYLRMKPETIRAMARRGELPAVKVGKFWRFKRSAIKDLVQGS